MNECIILYDIKIDFNFCMSKNRISTLTMDMAHWFIKNNMTSVFLISTTQYNILAEELPNDRPAHSLDISPTKWADYSISDQCAWFNNIF